MLILAVEAARNAFETYSKPAARAKLRSEKNHRGHDQAPARSGQAISIENGARRPAGQDRPAPSGIGHLPNALEASERSSNSRKEIGTNAGGQGALSALCLYPLERPMNQMDLQKVRASPATGCSQWC